MKNLVFFLFLSLISWNGFTQENSYLIIDPEQKLNGKELQFVKNSLNNADLGKYRLKNKRRVLNFENGIKVTLYSHEETRGNSAQTKNSQNIEEQTHTAIFKLSPSGHVLELHYNNNKK